MYLYAYTRLHVLPHRPPPPTIRGGELFCSDFDGFFRARFDRVWGGLRGRIGFASIIGLLCAWADTDIRWAESD